MLAALLAWAFPALAHPPLPTSALVKVDPQGRVTVIVRHDALAFALNDLSQNVPDPPMYALLDGPEPDLVDAFSDARRRFVEGFSLEADGSPLPTSITEFPEAPAVKAWRRENPDARLPLKLDIVAGADLPPSAKSLTVKFPEALGETIVTFDRPGYEPFALPLTAAERSPPLAVAVPAGVTEATESGAARAPDHESIPRVAWRYTRLGFEHIIPGGPDHALFVLGLFLLVPRFKTVLWQITAFTVAHTITLTLTALHIIGLPPRVVEPAIAASIAFIGVENLLVTRVHPWRIAVTFLFGLVHGMGVATAFNEAGFPKGNLVPALAAFTVGVEGGHIAVLAAAFALLAWWRAKPWYRARVAIPLSLVIAGIAGVWLVQRILAGR